MSGIYSWAKKRRMKFPPIDAEDAAVIKLLLSLGFEQHPIANLMSTNQGRVSEVNTKQRFPEVATPTIDWNV